jgi:hypothetical protein
MNKGFAGLGSWGQTGVKTGVDPTPSQGWGHGVTRLYIDRRDPVTLLAPCDGRIQK